MVRRHSDFSPVLYGMNAHSCLISPLRFAIAAPSGMEQQASLNMRMRLPEESREDLCTSSLYFFFFFDNVERSRGKKRRKKPCETPKEEKKKKKEHTNIEGEWCS